MKPYWILFAILLTFVIGSCGSLPSTTGGSTTSTPKGNQLMGTSTQSSLSDSPKNSAQSINTPDFTGMTPPSSDVNQFVELAKQDLAKRMKIREDEIILLKMTDITWQDITQGCTPTPGQTLTKGRLSGYRIWLEAGDKDYVYHIGLNGKIFLCPN